MSLTTEQYLALAQIAYQDFNLPADQGKSISTLIDDYTLPGEGTAVLAALSSMDGYTLVNYQSNTSSGFAGVAFQAPPGPNNEPGEIVFALRGTEANMSKDFPRAMADFEADLQIATDINLSGPSQFDDAFNFWTATLQDPDLDYSSHSFTGHSLGGGLAQYMTYMTNAQSRTFNAVGIGQKLPNVDPHDYDDLIKDYVNQNDIIGQYGIQLGSTIYLTDTGNFQFNSEQDNGQLALQIAIMKAMQQGDITQAAGMAALSALSEARQSAFNAGSDVFGGAHQLDTMVDANGNMSQPVTGPNLAIAILTQVINNHFTVAASIVNGISYFTIEIIPAVGEATVKVALAIAEGAVQVVTTIGEEVYDWANFMGETTADILYTTAVTIGSAANTVAEYAANLYQYFLGEYFTINGTGGADSLSPYGLNPVPAMSAVINGYSGDDSISGSSHDDILDGGSGVDTIYGDDGNDYIYGRQGNDILTGGWGADVIFGGDGDDGLYGESVDSTGSLWYLVQREDTLDGGVGNDYLAGGGGNDTYIFGIGYGQDTIDDKSRPYEYESFGSGGTLDSISFRAGVAPENVDVHRRDSNLEISIAGTSDKITVVDFGGDGKIEQAKFANGVVWDLNTILEKARHIYRATREGDSPNVLQGYDNQSDIIHGTNVDNLITGMGGNDIVYAEGGEDVISGGSGSDTLYGGSGDDILYGELEESTGGWTNVAADDILDGGAGNDLLVGAGGSDTYTFGRGYGQDTIDDKYRPYNYESFTGGGGLDTISFLTGIRPEDVGVRRRNGSDLEFRIAGVADKITVHDFFGNGAIERVIFADNTAWDLSTIREKARVITEATYDDDDSNTLTGYNSQGDIVYGTNADNLIETLGGDDTVYGSAGNDTIVGGMNADVLLGGAGNDAIYGDTVTSSGSFTSTSSADILDGGSGNDLLVGDTGNDTYIFGIGYGQDVIDDKHRLYSYDGYNGGGTLDTVSLLTGITPADILIRRLNGSDLELSIVDTPDKLTVLNFFNGGLGNGAVEQVVFADGTIWGIDIIQDKARYTQGTESNDVLAGYSHQNNIINAGAGNDTISGNDGSDMLFGEAGDDVVLASTGNDNLDGGIGNDRLEGSTGNDTYIFTTGSGVDTIYDSDSTASNVDAINFSEDISPGDVTAMRNGNNLELTISDSSDRLIIEYYFSSSNKNGSNVGENGNKIEEIRFADGTIWDIATIKETVRHIDGNEASESISGFTTNDVIAGLGGNDVISAGSGSDTLDGGTGNDALYGESGNDTYVFNLGYGADTILDSSGLDTVTFGEGVTADDITITRTSGSSYNQNNLIIGIKGTTDQLIINGYFYNGINSTTYKVEQFTFANGTMWTVDDIKEKLRTYTGTTGNDSNTNFGDQDLTAYGLDGDDVLSGSSHVDQFYGQNGNDSLSTSSGDDILDGGSGNDTLYGGSGNDTYVFGRGYGSDTIQDSSGGSDIIAFTSDVNPADITIRRTSGGSWNQNNLVLNIKGTDDMLTIQGYFYNGIDSNSTYKVEQFIFADGTVWTHDTIKESLRTYTGTENNDSNVNFGDQNLTAYGLGGDDTLSGSNYIDALYGGDGSDYLSASSGNDALDGGEGNDTLNGGSGNDTYIFAGEFGSDQISDTSGSDLVQFNNLLKDNLVFEQVGNKLQISSADSSDKVSINDWYQSTSYKVETIKASDGSIISNTQIGQLIQAMASFSTDNGMSWSQALDNQSSAAQSIIAQYWTAPTA